MTKKAFICFVGFTCFLYPLNSKAVSMPSHPHGIEWTSWEADSVGTYNFHPNNPSEGDGDPEAGDKRHQHYTATPLIDRNQAFNPFSVVFAWVNRVNHSFPQAPYPTVPHGFIDESNVDNIPRFRFTGNNWETDANAMKAQPLILKAFSVFSKLQALVSPVTQKSLITGLEFMPVKTNELAEIDIEWGGTTVLGKNTFSVGSDGIVSKHKILFNSGDIWFFGLAADTPLDKYHFFSTAIHEIGHAVGLFEQEDRDDVMIYARGPGPTTFNPDGTLNLTYGPAFDDLDDDSKEGALALYSIPAPVPVPVAVLGLTGAFGYTRKLRNLSNKLRKNTKKDQL